MLSAPRQKHGEPTPTTTTEPAHTKRDLTSWWRQFKRGNAKREDKGRSNAAESKARSFLGRVVRTFWHRKSPPAVKTIGYKPVPRADSAIAVTEPTSSGIFEVPLHESIRYANVAISLYDAEGKSYIYGYVPIIVAKCGVYLKETATEVEGVFRLSGSEKRIRELKAAFNSSEARYGKGLNWDGFTVHDAANILRRYFNTLPEPIIPLHFYDAFRTPIKGHQAQAVGEIDGQDPVVGEFHIDEAIRTYQGLITSLPPLNRQLLLYILDLLAVFAAKCDMNKMTTANLSAIFQPGILSHPQHAMAPKEYRLSQDILIFLINNQDHFLIGMQGTAADEKTVNEIKSGPATPTKSPAGGLARSGSNASAGAESIRKYGGIRRNVSVSSRNSRGSVAIPSPVSPAFTATSGVHRSNTLPSRRSPAVTPARFATSEKPDAEASSGLVDNGTSLAELSVANACPAEEPQTSLPAASDPTKPDALYTPIDQTTATRKPNKLQKKRVPSSNPSAHSSTQSLTK